MTLAKNRLLILISVVLKLPSFGQSNSYHISGALELPIKKGPVFIYLVDKGHFNIPNSGLDTIKIEVKATIHRLAAQVVSYAEKDFIQPQNFLGVGGHKIFRDEIFGHIRSVWQADRRYFRKHGLYDFEQKKRGLRMMNFFLLTAYKIPSFRKKYYQNIMEFPAKRFGKEMVD